MGRGRKRSNPEELIKKLVEASLVFGPNISCRQLNSVKGFPSKTQYRKYFGTYNRAKEIAGLKSNSADGHWKRKKDENGRLRKKKVYYLRLRFKILERDNFTCQYCGFSPQDGAKLQIDHITPYSRGGPTDESNLITACFECNIGKRDHLLHLKKENPE